MAACALLFTAGTAYGDPNTDQIDYNKYELDAQVSDMMWCGGQNEVILILTEKGTVYRSRDRGSSWKKLQSVMRQVGGEVADTDQEVSRTTVRLLERMRKRM